MQRETVLFKANIPTGESVDERVMSYRENLLHEWDDVYVSDSYPVMIAHELYYTVTFVAYDYY